MTCQADEVSWPAPSSLVLQQQHSKAKPEVVSLLEGPFPSYPKSFQQPSPFRSPSMGGLCHNEGLCPPHRQGFRRDLPFARGTKPCLPEGRWPKGEMGHPTQAEGGQKAAEGGPQHRSLRDTGQTARPAPQDSDGSFPDGCAAMFLCLCNATANLLSPGEEETVP